MVSAASSTSAAPRTICERMTPELPRAPIRVALVTVCASAGRGASAASSSASTSARTVSAAHPPPPPPAARAPRPPPRGEVEAVLDDHPQGDDEPVGSANDVHPPL